jgi:hypothetical protein
MPGEEEEKVYYCCSRNKTIPTFSWMSLAFATLQFLLIK